MKLVMVSKCSIVPYGTVDDWLTIEGSEGVRIAKTATISDDADICDSATIMHRAMVCDNTSVLMNATIKDKARMFDDSMLKHAAVMEGESMLCNFATIENEARLSDKAIVRDYARITHCAHVRNKTRVIGYVLISGNGELLKTDDYICCGPMGTSGNFITLHRDLSLGIRIYYKGIVGSIDFVLAKIKEIYLNTDYNLLSETIRALHAILTARMSPVDIDPTLELRLKKFTI